MAKLPTRKQLPLYSFGNYFKYIIEAAVWSGYLKFVASYKPDYHLQHFDQSNSKELKV